MIDSQDRAKSIFLSVLEIASERERTAYLQAQCGTDDELRREVGALLSHADRLGGFLESNAAGIQATIDLPAERIGSLIGRYKLLEQIGEGGMGIVFVAEQTEPVRRRVALKIIKPGMDSKQVIARFEAERQALAMMDHPNIAKILDAGMVGQASSLPEQGQAGSLPHAGRPYFVMELVRGMPITEYCDKARLSPRQRLELFVDVCQAVQHAHQKGIIHRDLKPSNVMVTMQDGRPVVKVIDFGVAKAVGQQLTERTVYTALTQLVGTPLYMSPEQAELTSHDVDTRSDVYSLGVLLYELLTGQTPFDKDTLAKAGLDEMRRIIREDEPPRPSHRVSTLNAQASSTISQHRSLDERHLSRVLRGELDWIVMKALEKDRSRRYESASALATDIQRYLSDEPVLACPPTTMYRFQKFARKHKPALATAAAIAACLILGTTVSAWQAARATIAEAQANANANQAQEKTKEATEQRDEAQKQRDEVKALADKLAAKEQQLQRALYASNMNLAKNSWDAGNVRRVDELLEQHRPKPAEDDLRGFEWYYLYRLCHAEQLILKGHTKEVNSVAYSPDGKRLASAANDGMVKIWDAHTGQDLLALKQVGSGMSVAFSPDGKRVASGNDFWDDTKNAFGSGEVTIWDAANGHELVRLKGHTGGVPSVAFSSNGNRMASADWEGVTKVWDAQTGQELLSLKDGGWTVAFSPDGKWLASGHNVWDVETGKEHLSLKDGAWCLAFSPDSKRLASASRRGGIKLWDAETGAELGNFKWQTGSNLAFNPDWTRLASGSRDGIVRVWDATTSQEARTLSGHTGRVRSVSFSPDGKRLAAASSGTRDDAKRAYVNGEVKVSDAQSGQELITLRGHTKAVNRVAYSPDGKRLATASADQTAKVWDAQSGRELLTLNGHTAEVVSVAFSPDGKRLATSSSDSSAMSNVEPSGEVKVWDAHTGEELRTLKGHSRFVNSVAFSPDGRRLATLSRDKTVKVWDSQTYQEILTVKASAYLGGSVLFSPDGKRLASTNAPPQSPNLADVKVWDALTGEEHLTLKGGGVVWSVVFSPDGKRLVSSGGQQLKVWDAVTGQELLSLDGINQLPNDLTFSADGHRLAGVGQAGTVKIYDATPLPEKH